MSEGPIHGQHNKPIIQGNRADQAPDKGVRSYFRENRLRQYSHIQGREPLCAAMCLSRCSVLPKLCEQTGQTWRAAADFDVEKFVDGDEPVWEPVADIVAPRMGPRGHGLRRRCCNLRKGSAVDGLLYSGPRLAS